LDIAADADAVVIQPAEERDDDHCEDLTGLDGEQAQDGEMDFGDYAFERGKEVGHVREERRRQCGDRPAFGDPHLRPSV